MKLLFNFYDITGYFHSLVYLIISLIWTWLVHSSRNSLISWALNNSWYDQTTKSVPSKLTSFVIKSWVNNPAPSTSFRLPHLIISECKIGIVLCDAFIRLLMHLFNIDIVHLILVELVRWNIEYCKCNVQNSQPIASRTMDCVVKEGELEVVDAKTWRGWRLW